MESRRTKLGDVIDDYCTRCRLLMNHGVVGMVGDEVRKVRCLTCMFEHPYRRARLPKRRDTTKALFEQVRKSLPQTPPESLAAPEPPGGSDASGRPAPAATPPKPVRKPRSHSLAAQRGVHKGRPFHRKPRRNPGRR